MPGTVTLSKPWTTADRSYSAVMVCCTGWCPAASWRRHDLMCVSNHFSRARSSLYASGWPVASTHAFRSSSVAVCLPFSSLLILGWDQPRS